MMFWAKIEQSAVSQNPSLPKYVLSSGGGDKRSRGFSFLHQNGQFVVRVVAAQKKWKIEIEHGVIPFGKWFSFAFTWTAGMYDTLPSQYIKTGIRKAQIKQTV